MIENINSAILAHKKWRETLFQMIDSGLKDIDPNFLRSDNNCEFGKYLYSDLLDKNIKSTELFNEIMEIHKKFHIEAAKIAELTIQGNVFDSLILLKNDSDYNTLSNHLIYLLEKLKIVK